MHKSKCPQNVQIRIRSQPTRTKTILDLSRGLIQDVVLIQNISPCRGGDHWARWGQFQGWSRPEASSCAGWSASFCGSSVSGEHPLLGSSGAAQGTRTHTIWTSRFAAPNVNCVILQRWPHYARDLYDCCDKTPKLKRKPHHHSPSCVVWQHECLHSCLRQHSWQPWPGASPCSSSQSGTRASYSSSHTTNISRACFESLLYTEIPSSPWTPRS